ncbi:MAG: sigma-54-dependent Fis family transcriptional regulator [Nitrospinae bacterium]|nr:sigma-54-dependent Fis family transcriptional regulator [Nitrospinota bacterium]
MPPEYAILKEIPENGSYRFPVIVDVDSVSSDNISRLRDHTFVVALTEMKEAGPVMESASLGAYEVALRPLDARSLMRVLEDIEETIGEVEKRVAVKNPSPAPTCAIVGFSPEIMAVCKRMARLAQVEVPVLITGETGTGKELIAESIAQNSRRIGKPFVVVNCAAVPETLLESELFGFEKGAFTGAVTAKDGLMKTADGGTVFLDEIGELPLVLQGKLLRFIQTQTFYPLGSTREVQVNVRVISATNRDLSSMARQGQFREDLYHRLRVASIHLPPLRERKSDIIPLVHFFVYRHSHLLGKPVRFFTKAYLEKLASFDWPGNIRELENIIRSSIAFSRLPFLTAHDIGELSVISSTPAVADNFGSFVAPYLAEALVKGGKNIYREVHNELDRHIFEHLLNHNRLKLNVSELARFLGLNRITVRRKIGMFGNLHDAQ